MFAGLCLLLLLLISSAGCMQDFVFPDDKYERECWSPWDCPRCQPGLRVICEGGFCGCRKPYTRPRP